MGRILIFNSQRADRARFFALYLLCWECAPRPRLFIKKWGIYNVRLWTVTTENTRDCKIINFIMSRHIAALRAGDLHNNYHPRRTRRKHFQQLVWTSIKQWMGTRLMNFMAVSAWKTRTNITVSRALLSFLMSSQESFLFTRQKVCFNVFLHASWWSPHSACVFFTAPNRHSHSFV